MRLLALVTTGLLVTAGAAQAQDFRWHSALASGKTLEIRGVSGRVHAVRASGSEAEVTAVKKAGRRGDPDDVEIKVVEDADGVTICALYPTRRSRQSDCRSGGNRDENYRDTDVEVNFDVKVPAGVDFVGVTVNGDVDARDMPADAEVSTVNGDVEVTAAGLARGTTAERVSHGDDRKIRLDRDPALLDRQRRDHRHPPLGHRRRGLRQYRQRLDRKRLPHHGPGEDAPE